MSGLEALRGELRAVQQAQACPPPQLARLESTSHQRALSPAVEILQGHQALGRWTPLQSRWHINSRELAVSSSFF